MEPCLSCIYLTYCMKIFIMNWYISKSFTTRKNTIDRQYTERGQLLCQLLLVCTWYLAYVPLVISQNCLKFHSPNGSWNYVQQLRNITRGVYAKYHNKSCYYLYKSGTLGFGIRKKDQRIRVPLTTGIWNASSTDKESVIHRVESRIQDCLEFS